MNRAIVGATLTVLSLSLPAMAGTTNKYTFKGQSASASFYQQNDDCSASSVYVWAADNVSRSAPGAPSAQKEAQVYYSNSNWCTGQYSYGYGSAPDATFTSNNSLKSAALNGTFTVYEYSSDNPESEVSKTVNVALAWTGTGDTFRGNSHSLYQWMGGMSRSRYNGSYRDAQVSGNVSLDGKNLISNLASYASLYSTNSGSMEIVKR